MNLLIGVPPIVGHSIVEKLDDVCWRSLMDLFTDSSSVMEHAEFGTNDLDR